MKAKLVWLWPFLLTACLEDGLTKVNRCDSVRKITEANTAGVSTSYSATDRISMRLRFYEAVTLKKIMLKAIVAANSSFQVDFYRGSYLDTPTQGTLVGSGYVWKTPGSTTLQEVWSDFFEPVYLPEIPDDLYNSYYMVITFLSSISLDYGASTGSFLRSDFRTGSTFAGGSWNYVDSSNSVTVGFEADVACDGE